jgi:CelD/BcsL family acetyltransferase involved in cellulose biosynthesis
VLRAVAWNSFHEAEAMVRPFLREHNQNIFLSFDWTVEYSRRVREPHGWRPLPVGVFREDRMVAFALLSVRRGTCGIPIVTFTGEGRGAYLGLAGESSAEVIETLRNELVRLLPHAVLRLADVVEGDPLLDHFDASTGLAAVHRTAVYPCPFRDLRPGAPADSPSHRTFQKRIPGYARRLERFGEVRHLLLDFDAAREQALEWLPRLFALHDLRHGQRRNPWTAPGNRAFLAAWLESAERTQCLCFVLLLDGLPVAFDLGFRVGDSFCLHIPAFHTAFEKFRLGHINRYFSYAACRELGIGIYDFARGDAFAKRIWATGKRDNFDLVAAAGTSRRAWLVAQTMAAKTRAMVWARGHGLSRSKLTRWWYGWLNRAGAAPPAALPEQPARQPGQTVPFRYGLVADLPLDLLTRVVGFVSAEAPSNHLDVQWVDSQTLRVTGSNPASEIVLCVRAPRRR